MGHLQECPSKSYKRNQILCFVFDLEGNVLIHWLVFIVESDKI